MFSDIITSFAALQLGDVPTILTLVLLEGVLSADNALVIAALVKDLKPVELQRRATKIGIWFAYLSRFIVIFIAGPLLSYPIVRWGAALYLVYVGIAGMRAKAGEKDELDDGGFPARLAKKLGLTPFWQVVVAVELADIAFSVDSIAAAMAFSNKLAVIFIGGCLGILAMRFVANWFLTLIHTYTVLEKTAFLIVFLIGLKLLLHAGDFPGIFGVTWIHLDYHLPEWLSIGSTLTLFFGAIAISHFFPTSWVAQIGRKEAKELEEEIAIQTDTKP